MSGPRQPMLEHECAGCDGMLDCFVSGILHAYDEPPLEREFLESIETDLKELLIEQFGFCRTHAEQAVGRLREHAKQGKKVNSPSVKGEPS